MKSPSLSFLHMSNIEGATNLEGDYKHHHGKDGENDMHTRETLGATGHTTEIYICCKAETLFIEGNKGEALEIAGKYRPVTKKGCKHLSETVTGEEDEESGQCGFFYTIYIERMYIYSSKRRKKVRFDAT